MEIIRQAFEMTRTGRLHIINDILLPCIAEPRAELSKYAPRIITIQIPVDKIREVIGSGGKVINKIIADTGAQIDIEDDGRIYIATPDAQKAQKALAIINGIVNDPIPGAEYDGVVTRLMAFGAFVEILPSKEGLVHISKMAWTRVDKVEDVVKEGDVVKVKVMEIDNQGRINLSMRDCMEKPEGYVESADSPRRDSGDRFKRERRGPSDEHRDRPARFDRPAERGDRGDRSTPDSGENGFRRRPEPTREPDETPKPGGRSRDF
jgi:polyribonucleotide nucleotidyltransferase